MKRLDERQRRDDPGARDPKPRHLRLIKSQVHRSRIKKHPGGWKVPTGVKYDPSELGGIFTRPPWTYVQPAKKQAVCQSWAKKSMVSGAM